MEKLAATYSRGVYKTTTIGKAVFDGRVRNGNGSDHSFMATKKYLKNVSLTDQVWGKEFSENCTQGRQTGILHVRELKSQFFYLPGSRSCRAGQKKKRSSRTTD